MNFDLYGYGNNESSDNPDNLSGMFRNIFGNRSDKSLFNQALDNDNRLKKIAYYAITEGGIKTFDLNELESAKEFLTTLLDKFAEFKALVKRGSFTLQELENHVALEYGIVDNPPEQFDVDSIEVMKGNPSETETDKTEKEGGQDRLDNVS